MGNTAGLLEIKFERTNHERVAQYSSQDGASETANPRFVAGNSINGCVSVDFVGLAERFPGKPLDFSVVIQVIGKEKSKICQGATVRKAERTLLLEQKLLHRVKPDEAWPTRWYDFSFDIEIPSDMPGSLYCEEGRRRSYAELSYQVQAVLDTSLTFGWKNSGLKALVAFRDIEIQAAPVPPIVVPYMMQPSTHKVKTFGVKSKGTILFGVTVADTHVGPGEFFEWSFACRNHSTVDVQALYIRLVETITWRIDSANHVRTVEKELSSFVEPCLIPKKKDLWYTTSIEEDIDERDDDLIAMYHELRATGRTFQLKVPIRDDVCDDYAGPLVKCTHRLEVRVKTEDHVDDPRVSVPVQLKQFIPLKEYRKRKESELFYLPRTNTLEDEDGQDDVDIPLTRSDMSEVACFSAGSSMRRNEVAMSSTSRMHPVPEAYHHQATLSAGQDAFPRNLPRENRLHRPTNNRLALDEEGSTSRFEENIPLSLFIAGGRAQDVMASSSSSFSSAGGGPVSYHLSELDQEAKLPSFPNLLDEMLVSVDDFNIVCRKLVDPEWAMILINETPEDFGLMVSHVNVDHDQPRVAAVVARQIYLQSSSFSCEHIVMALRNCADWTRCSIVQKLLSYCYDLAERHHILLQDLTPWELTVLADDIENALTAK